MYVRTLLFFTIVHLRLFQKTKKYIMSLRVGFGIDFHQLVTDREFWLGGVKIAHHKGALGHSDADVLSCLRQC